MALDDFRTWLDVKAQDGRHGSIALEAIPTRDALRVAVIDAEGVAIELELDYPDAGMLFDQLSAGMGVLLARTGNPTAAAAVIGKRVAETQARNHSVAAGTADTPSVT